MLLKREDLNHTGSHKINNVLGQALLTKRMGKPRVIAETGAGQHGVATATACALLGLDCVVYMGEVDTVRQALNVARMRLLGAEVIPVTTGSRTLKDAINEALRDWVTNVDDTHYLLGTVAGPHPFPVMVRDFQRVIGLEARAQVLERYGRLPGRGRRLRRRRLQRDRHLPRVPRRPGRPAGRVRGRRRRAGDRAARRDADRRVTRRAARRAVLPAAGRRRPDHRDALDLGRAGLPRRGAGARAAQGHRPGRVPADHRRGGDGGVRAAVPHRGHHPGDRVGARRGRRAGAGPRARAGRDRAGQPVRPRRQGRGHRGEVVRAATWRWRHEAGRHERDPGLRTVPRGAARRADRLPARRLPDRGGVRRRCCGPCSTAAATWSRSGCRTRTR